ncbi:MAG TPA: hypothetical protein VJ927_11135 [Actinomycetota bacterium]|nr:hypothetical protein [Actinomycetota bacterium]
MGARLVYAKVIDRERYIVNHRGKVHPGLENLVQLREEPGVAAAFLVLRGWGEDHGTFTEQWRIESPGGVVVYESSPREIHSPTNAHIEKLEDEVADAKFEYAATYTLAFTLNEDVVARVNFPVELAPNPNGG